MTKNAQMGFKKGDIGKFKFSEWWHGIMTPDLDPRTYIATLATTKSCEEWMSELIPGQ